MSNFEDWKKEYGLVYEPNYSSMTEADCLAAFKAGQQSILQELEKYLRSYKAQSNLPMTDEFNRGWVSAFGCVVKDLEKVK